MASTAFEAQQNNTSTNERGIMDSEASLSDAITITSTTNGTTNIITATAVTNSNNAEAQEVDDNEEEDENDGSSSNRGVKRKRSSDEEEEEEAASSGTSANSTKSREASAFEKIQQQMKKHKMNHEIFPYPGLTEKESKKVKRLLTDDRNFVCCISRSLMKNPVSLTQYPERVYDKKSLQSWLESNTMEPSTGMKLDNKTFHPNRFARQLLDDYKDKVIKKSRKLIKLFIREKRGWDSSLKLVDRCLALNSDSMLTRRIEILEDKLAIFGLQDKPITDRLLVKMLIARTYVDKDYVKQWSGILKEILVTLNNHPELVPVNKGVEHEDDDDEEHSTETKASGETCGSGSDLNNFRTKVSSFLNEFHDTVVETKNIEDRDMLLEFASYYKKKNDIEGIHTMNEKIIETRDSVNSLRLYEVTHKAFQELIAYAQEEKHYDPKEASSLIVKHIGWQQREDMKQLIAPSKNSASSEVAHFSTDCADIVTRLKHAVELHKENVRAYELIIGHYSKLEDKSVYISDISQFMLDHLIQSLSERKVDNSSTRCPNIIHQQKFEKKYFLSTIQQYLGKTQDTIVELKIKKASEYGESSTISSKSFELCGLEWRIDYHPKRSTSSGVCYSGCSIVLLSDYTLPLEVQIECEVKVLEPEDSEEALDQLTLIPQKRISLRLNSSGGSTGSSFCQTGQVPGSILDEYRTKNDKVYMFVHLTLKRGSVL